MAARSGLWEVRLGSDGAASLLLAVVCFVIGLPVGGVGFLPLVSDRGPVRPGYENLAWVGLAFLVLVMAVLRSGWFSPGHELGRDGRVDILGLLRPRGLRRVRASLGTEGSVPEAVR